MLDEPAGSSSQESSPPARKRRRGAPPGNANALKHGLYSHAYQQRRAIPAGDALADGLRTEITMLREMLQRAADIGASANSLDDILNLLRTFSLASSSITRLVRTHELFYGFTADEPPTSLPAAPPEADPSTE